MILSFRPRVKSGALANSATGESFLGFGMRQCMDGDNLRRRIGKIMRQLKAIEKMIGEDILIQINAAKGALHKVGQVVLEWHLNHCVREGIEHGDADKTSRTSLLLNSGKSAGGLALTGGKQKSGVARQR